MEEQRKKRGRPKKEAGIYGGYQSRYCADILRYFGRKAQKITMKKTYHADGTLKSEEPVVLPQELPTFQGFAGKIGARVEELEKWRLSHPEFDEAYGRARELQEKILLVNSLNGLYSSQFSQFFFKSCMGPDEKEEEKEGFAVTIRVVEE